MWMHPYPTLMHTVLDTTDARGLAEFYRELLGLRYRAGDEPDPSTDAGSSVDDADWLVLVDSSGRRVLALQQVAELARSTWPATDVPMQLHLDFGVSSRAELEHHRARAELLGATLILDRTGGEDGSEDHLYVLADPAGHPFCLLVTGHPTIA